MLILATLFVSSVTVRVTAKHRSLLLFTCDSEADTVIDFGIVSCEESGACVSATVFMDNGDAHDLCVSDLFS